MFELDFMKNYHSLCSKSKKYWNILFYNGCPKLKVHPPKLFKYVIISNEFTKPIWGFAVFSFYLAIFKILFFMSNMKSLG